MRKFLATTGTLLALTLAHTGTAQAFQFENPGAANPNAPAGFVDLDMKASMQPIGQGEPVQGLKYDHGPGSYNNGFANAPSGRDVEPHWLYGPRR